MENLSKRVTVENVRLEREMNKDASFDTEALSTTFECALVLFWFLLDLNIDLCCFIE